jgi:hypothetical protein
LRSERVEIPAMDGDDAACGRLKAYREIVDPVDI